MGCPRRSTRGISTGRSAPCGISGRRSCTSTLARSAAKSICPSAGCDAPAMVTAKRARRRWTRSANGKRSTSITAAVFSERRLTQGMKHEMERTMERGVELEAVIDGLLKNYLSRNLAARVLQAALDEVGVGFRPVVDHLTIRTLDIDRRAEEFLRLGYGYAETLNYDDWFAKVYRAPGFPPLFIDQAYPDARGASSIIPGWVAKFGDRTLHHVAVLVGDIEWAIHRLKAQGVVFTGNIVGVRGGPLRQIFTAPERVDGEAFSVLELTERHHGFLGFSPPQANALMRSSVGTG